MAIQNNELLWHYTWHVLLLHSPGCCVFFHYLGIRHRHAVSSEQTGNKNPTSDWWVSIQFLFPGFILNEIPSVYPFKVTCSLWNPWHFDEKCNKRKQYLVFMVSLWKSAGSTLTYPENKHCFQQREGGGATTLEWNRSLMRVCRSVSVGCRSKHSEACCQIQNVDLSFRLVLSWSARLNGDLDWGPCASCTPGGGKTLQDTPNYTARVHGFNKKKDWDRWKRAN